MGAATLGTRVAIVDLETEELCNSQQLGEIWVASDLAPVNFALSDVDVDEEATAETLRCKLAGDPLGLSYCRTGLLGFAHVRVVACVVCA